MNIDANVPVIYLDAFDTSIESVKCNDKTIEVIANDDRLAVEDRALIVMGKYSCGDSMVVGRNWRRIGDRITFEVSDPAKEGVSGNYRIQLNRRRRQKDGRWIASSTPDEPKDMHFGFPFPFGFDFTRRISLYKDRVIINCNPCGMQGTVNLDVTIHGALFSKEHSINARVTSKMSSTFQLTANIQNNTDGNESTTLMKVPLGAVNVPNVVSIGPSFVISLKANVKSFKDYVISAGQTMEVPEFDANLVHIGSEDTLNSGAWEYNPDIVSLPTTLNTVGGWEGMDLNTEPEDNQGLEMTLEFNPALQIEGSLFGQDIFDGAKVEVGHSLKATSRPDNSCPSKFFVDVTTQAAIYGNLGAIKSPISKLSEKVLLHGCMEKFGQ